MKKRLLRLFLFIGAFGWGISALGIFLPWETVVPLLNGLGAGPIPTNPMLNYWLRMTAGAYTGIGMLFLVAGLRPVKYKNLIRLLGILSVAEGITLLVHGLWLGLRPFPFYGDVSFCLLIGTGIWICRDSVK